MVFILSSHMVSFLISVSPQLLPIQWKISDTFKIKKPVKSLRGEVIFAIIKLIKNRRLSLAQGRAASKHVLNGSPAQIGPRGASLFLPSVRIQQHLHSRGREHLDIPPVLLCPSAVIFL